MSFDVNTEQANSNEAELQATASERAVGTIPWICLLVVTAAVYVQAVGFGAVPSWDDSLFVLDRETVTHWWNVTWYQRIATPEVGYAMPIPTFVFAHVRLLVGETAYPHVLHALSIGVHLFNVVLVGKLVSRWSRPTLGYVVAAVWGLHPIGVESVAWLTNLKTVSAAAGVLGGLWCWERVLAEGTSLRWSLATAGCLLLALGCRPDAVVLVPVAAARSLWCVGWRVAFRRYGAWLAGFAVVGAAWVIWAKVGHDSVVEYSAVMPGTQSTPVRMARALELSLRHLLFPIDLDPGYFRDPTAGLLYALPGAVIGLGLVALFATSLIARWYQIAFGIALFGVWYAPFSGVVFLPRFIADTYLYGPAIGVIFALVAGVDRWWAARRPASGRSVAFGVATLLVVLGTVTFFQVGRWENAKTLWGPVLEEKPKVVRPYEQVAWYYSRAEAWKEARDVCEAGLPVFRASKQYPYFLAAVYDQAGQPRRAAELAVEAVLQDANPKDLHYKTLLDVFARREIPPPADRSVREAIQRAAGIYTQHDEWMSRQIDRLHIADYLTKHFEPALAIPFVRREFQVDRPDCFTWIAAERIRRAGEAGTLQIPPVPARCRSKQDEGQR